MAGRTFAQINCSLLGSRKLRGLGHSDRWVYLCTHLTPLGSFSGVFGYPEVMWAHDACMTPDELEEARTHLCEAGLIEWAPEDELVRIIGFHRQRPPENASRVISMVADFQDMLLRQDDGMGLTLRCAAEFSVAAVTRAQSWKPDSPEHQKLRECLRPFLIQTYQEFEDNFLAALSDETDTANKAAKGELGALLPPLTLQWQDTLSTPCPDPVDTRDVDETRPRQDEDKYKDEKKTAGFYDTDFEYPASLKATPDLPRIGTETQGASSSAKLSRLAQEAARREDF